MAAGDMAPFSFAPSLLTGSLTTLYTVPTGNRLISLELTMLLVTESAAAVTARVHFTTKDGTPSATDRVVDQSGTTQLAVGETRGYAFNPMMQGGATIRALAHSANVVSVRGAGMLRADS